MGVKQISYERVVYFWVFDRRQYRKRVSVDDESFWVECRYNVKSQLYSASSGSKYGSFFWETFFGCFLFVLCSTLISAVVFGAISGDLEVVRLLLLKGFSWYIKGSLFLLLSFVRLSLSTRCISNQGGELSCMEWWMFVSESPISFSIVFMRRVKGFIGFSFWLKRGSYFGFKMQLWARLTWRDFILA